MKKQFFFLLSALLFLHFISFSQKTDSIVDEHSKKISNLTQQVSGIKTDIDTIKTKITHKTLQMDSNFFKDVIIILAVTLLAILIVYIFCAWYWPGLIKSKLLESGKAFEADLLYYLPTATLQMKATATLVITKRTSDNLIISAKLVELVFDNTVKLVADTQKAFVIQYTPSIFNNEEISLAVSPDGLLQNFSFSAEDRITNIITQITEAPSKILSTAQNAPIVRVFDGPPPPKEPVTTQTIVISNSFGVLASELKTGVEITKPWKINPATDGAANDLLVDASFIIKFLPGDEIKAGDIKAEEVQVEKIESSMNGLLTRPLRTAIVTIRLKSEDPETPPPIEYEIQIPDVSRIIQVPIKRSAFIKRVNTPKFESGILVSNSISKPSEVEGFLSIPINICKAIVSIPAQLFTFKIQNDNRKNLAELEMQKQTLALQSSIELSKDSINKSKSELDTAKIKITDLEKQLADLKLKIPAK